MRTARIIFGWLLMMPATLILIGGILYGLMVQPLVTLTAVIVIGGAIAGALMVTRA